MSSQATPAVTLSELLTDISRVSRGPGEPGSGTYDATVSGARVVIRAHDGAFECWAQRPGRGGFIASEGADELQVVQAAALLAQIGSIK